MHVWLNLEKSEGKRETDCVRSARIRLKMTEVRSWGRVGPKRVGETVLENERRT